MLRYQYIEFHRISRLNIVFFDISSRPIFVLEGQFCILLDLC